MGTNLIRKMTYKPGLETRAPTLEHVIVLGYSRNNYNANRKFKSEQFENSRGIIKGTTAKLGNLKCRSIYVKKISRKRKLNKIELVDDIFMLKTILFVEGGL